MEAQQKHVTVRAPATVANVGPGFDVLGLALHQPFDTIHATVTTSDQPQIQLSVDPLSDGIADNADTNDATESHPPSDKRNTAFVAAQNVLDRLKATFHISLRLGKGMPVGSGLGSSGASAVAAAVAVNALAGDPLSRQELLTSCVEAERSACGSAHADNVAPGLLGGIALVLSSDHVVILKTNLDLWLAVITPKIELLTRDAREAIPQQIPLADALHNQSRLAALSYALATDDLNLLGHTLDDRIAEPRRAPLIPGFDAVKQAALSSGALGASISGAGPSIFALCHGQETAKKVSTAMAEVSATHAVTRAQWLSPINRLGATVELG